VHDLSVLDGNDRDEPVVVLGAGRQNLTMDIVFDDDNARVLRSVHDELISAVEDDVVAVARIECHQGVTTTNCLGPSGEMISKFKLRVIDDGVEIVVAVD